MRHIHSAFAPRHALKISRCIPIALTIAGDRGVDGPTRRLEEAVDKLHKEQGNWFGLAYDVLDESLSPTVFVSREPCMPFGLVHATLLQAFWCFSHIHIRSISAGCVHA